MTPMLWLFITCFLTFCSENQLLELSPQDNTEKKLKIFFENKPRLTKPSNISHHCQEVYSPLLYLSPSWNESKLEQLCERDQKAMKLETQALLEIKNTFFDYKGVHLANPIEIATTKADQLAFLFELSQVPSLRKKILKAFHFLKSPSSLNSTLTFLIHQESVFAEKKKKESYFSLFFAIDQMLAFNPSEKSAKEIIDNCLTKDSSPFHPKDHQKILNCLQKHENLTTNFNPDEVFVFEYEKLLQNILSFFQTTSANESEIKNHFYLKYLAFQIPSLLKSNLLLTPSDYQQKILETFLTFFKSFAHLFQLSQTRHENGILLKIQKMNKKIHHKLFKDSEYLLKVYQSKIEKSFEIFLNYQEQLLSLGKQQKEDEVKKLKRDLDKQLAFLSFCQHSKYLTLPLDYSQALRYQLTFLDMVENLEYVLITLEKGEKSYLHCRLSDFRYPGCLFKSQSQRNLLAEIILNEPNIKETMGSSWSQFPQMQRPKKPYFFWKPLLIQ
jgi:hypothetical protein